MGNRMWENSENCMPEMPCGCGDRESRMERREMSCGCEDRESRRERREMPCGCEDRESRMERREMPCGCEDRESRAERRETSCGCNERSGGRPAVSNYNYIYSITSVQVPAGRCQCYLDMMKKMDCHFKKHHEDTYSGMQIYQNVPGTFIVIMRYYDKPECEKEYEKMMYHAQKMYHETFGRMIRRRVIVPFDRKCRVYY